MSNERHVGLPLIMLCMEAGVMLFVHYVRNEMGCFTLLLQPVHGGIKCFFVYESPFGPNNGRFFCKVKF